MDDHCPNFSMTSNSPSMARHFKCFQSLLSPVFNTLHWNHSLTRLQASSLTSNGGSVKHDVAKH